MRKVFIWNLVNLLTTRYHQDGALVIVANDLAHARELLAEEIKDVLTYDGNTIECDAFTKAPDFSYDVLTNDSKVFIFPDAGCC